ncbi:hypothetical protein [Rhodococcus sp. 27YEA6]|uniref:hypothetical protein n=1 Tax=Rhodococcus sp. 27YEA6 TaxID=3156273 RepID=UPI003837D35F
MAAAETAEAIFGGIQIYHTGAGDTPRLGCLSLIESQLSFARTTLMTGVGHVTGHTK